VAATEKSPSHSLLAAALLLPGVLPLAQQARAETAPEQAVFEARVLDYQDRQPGLDRTHVQSPALYLLLPVRGEWALEASLVNDGVSGASPRHHTSISSASRQTEQRNAGEARLTHYGARESWYAGAALSDEHDFKSQALSGGASFSSEDNNRTVSIGAAYTQDRIRSTDDPTLDERRRTAQLSAALTQNLSPRDIAQASLTLSHGTGFYDDPYKFPDHRPDHRDQTAVALRWNHHFESDGATLRSGYRYYTDSFGVRAHTLDVAWVQPLGERWQLTPGLRYYTQSAASFYVDPVYDAVLGEPYPPGWRPGTIASGDQRLSAFGALSASLQAELKLNAACSASLKLEGYEQRADWRVGGKGSPGLAPFYARWVQLGLSYRF
jgi:hypothetical protein